MSLPCCRSHPRWRRQLSLLSLLQIINDIKANQQQCLRMEGKWDDAPQSLLENILEFEVTLLPIRDIMLRAAQAKWIGRLMAKSSIRGALLPTTEGRGYLESLIEIHYAIGSTKGDSTKPLIITDKDTITSPVEFPELLPQSSAGSLSESTVSTFEFENIRCSSESTDSFTLPTEEELFLTSLNGETDVFGSDVLVRKANRKAVSWFAGTSEVQAGG
ncbi:hypothetical protein V8E53_000523 [Lactarius tabidus]